ncbi:hypothetical protein SAY87_028769 [Trapa incisa]|uniref:Uncharacterized protein n=1 Tax=Trapa incisa TaxID=236973 RepID=A0AAN7QSC2_9MYRT|nr:hypothetical protein SAY87_028769 [Trapa incisa]
MAYSVKVKVSSQNGTLLPMEFELCFHRNSSIGVCKCPQSKWEKVGKGSWSRPMSPFDQRIIDIRVGRSSSPVHNTFEVSVKEEFFLYRVVLLFLGLVLMISASSLSQSLVFYYSSAMAVGIILVLLVVLFQGMKLLPTGRKSSLAIFLYSSLVGLGSFFLRYLPGFFRSILVEMGISEDMYNPLATFLLAFLVLTGAWLGFWAVRKLILTEEGSVDISTSNFVAWAIRILASVMILQCSLDPILAAEALILAIVMSSLLGRVIGSRVFHHLYRNLFASSRDRQRRSKMEFTGFNSPYEGSNGSKLSPISSRSLKQGYGQSPSQQPSTPENFYSTFHSMPKKRQYSKDEWKKLTRDYTKKSLEELVSSPEFSKWAVANAERITLAPKNVDTRSGFYHRLRRWLPC